MTTIEDILRKNGVNFQLIDISNISLLMSLPLPDKVQNYLQCMGTTIKYHETNRGNSPFIGETANPAEPVNGQDERAAPAVDSPARLCWQVIKGRTARSAAAPHHYRKKPCTSLRQRGFLPFSSFQMCPGRA